MELGSDEMDVILAALLVELGKFTVVKEGEPLRAFVEICIFPSLVMTYNLFGSANDECTAIIWVLKVEIGIQTGVELLRFVDLKTSLTPPKPKLGLLLLKAISYKGECIKLSDSYTPSPVLYNFLLPVAS